jgi:hypothetical protein
MALKKATNKSQAEETLIKIKKFVEDTRSEDAIWVAENRQNEDLPEEVAKADHRIAFCDMLLEMMK